MVTLSFVEFDSGSAKKWVELILAL